MKNTYKFIISIVTPPLAGFIGSLFTTPSIPNWYAGLIKPELNPPSWVFAPVWTILYLMMGLAAFLVWKEGYERREVRHALKLYAFQLVLNMAWSIIFFGLKNPAAALIEIIILWLAILATIFAFFKVSKLAGSLLVPYILWVSFATYLTYSIWALN